MPLLNVQELKLIILYRVYMKEEEMESEQIVEILTNEQLLCK